MLFNRVNGKCHFILFATLLAGCAGLPRQQSNSGELPSTKSVQSKMSLRLKQVRVMWLHEEDKAFESALSSIGKSHGVNIKLVRIEDQDTYLDCLMNMIQRGDAPDVFWVPRETVHFLAKQGHIAEVSRFVEEHPELIRVLTEDNLEHLVYEGGLYGIPFAPPGRSVENAYVVASTSKQTDLPFYIAQHLCLLKSHINPATALKGWIRDIVSGHVRDIEIADNLAYVAAVQSDIVILDVTNIVDPVVGTIETDGDPFDVEVVDNETFGKLAYIADGKEGLRIVDVSVPSAPTLVSVLEARAIVRSVKVRGNHAFIHDGARFWSVDISDPYTPRRGPYLILWPYEANRRELAVDEAGQYAYVAAPGVLRIFDLSSSDSRPVISEYRYGTTFTHRSIDVDDNKVYIVGDLRDSIVLIVVDVSDPASPAELGRATIDIPAPRPEYVKAVGSCVYAVIQTPPQDHGWGGVAVINASDPTAPYQFEWLETPVYPTCLDEISMDVSTESASGLGALLFVGLKEGFQVFLQCPPRTQIHAEDGRCVWDWTGKYGLKPDGEASRRGVYNEMNYPFDVESPWHTVHVPASLDQFGPDNRPEDGWRLLKTLFSTAEHPDPRDPFFALYNKYDGRLRVFFFTVNQEEYYTKSAISMHFGGALAQRTKLLNLGGGGAFASDYLGDDVVEYQKVAPTQFAPYQWAWAEFLTSYDPETKEKTNPILRIAGGGTTISELGLFGTISLETPSAYTTKKTGADGIVDIFDKTYKTYETVSKLSDSIEEKLEEIEAKKHPEGEKLWDLFFPPEPEELSLGKELLDEVFGGKLGEFLLDNAGIIGAASGLLGSLFSGGSGYAAIALEGSFSIRGTITTEEYTGERQLRIPGTKTSLYEPLEFAPVYDRPLGTFTLSETPVFISAVEREFHKQQSDPEKWGLVGNVRTWRALDNIKYVINPHSGLRLRELYVAIVFCRGRHGCLKQGSCVPESYLSESPLAFLLIPDGNGTAMTGDGEEFTYCKYRTPFVPYDRFKDVPLYQYALIKLRPPPFYWWMHRMFPLGVRILAIMERTDDDATAQTVPVVFSDVFNIYWNVAMRSLRDCLLTGNCADVIPDGWKENYPRDHVGVASVIPIDDFRDDTVGKKIRDLFQSGAVRYNTFIEGFQWTESKYSLDHPWPEIDFGNLTVNHDKVDQHTIPDVFYVGEKIIARFVQYKERVFAVRVDKYEEGKWRQQIVHWDESRYCKVSPDERLESLSAMLGYDTGKAKYYESDFSFSSPGRYRIFLLGNQKLIKEFEVREP